jgi:DNA mismatch repair protein MSH4
LNNLVFMNRADFNEDRGLRYIQSLGTEKCLSSAVYACDKKYYALSSVSALFSYMEQQLNVSFHCKSIIFQTKSLEGPVFIGNNQVEGFYFLKVCLDYHSAKSLELVCSNGDSKSDCNLLQAVNKCQTLMGKRLLRMNILQPLTDLKQIHSRQEAIQGINNMFVTLIHTFPRFAHPRITFDTTSRGTF